MGYDGSLSDPIEIRRGCVLAPTLFVIFFSLLLNFAFQHFNLYRLKAKTKVRTVLLREMLFADDAALTSHTEESLQQLINQFAHACKDFGLIISIKKTNVICQDVLQLQKS